MSEEDYKIAYENVMIAYKMLEQENKQLRKALETKYYCQYANKCNELYDCTREEYETMAQCNMKLSLEIAELTEKIDTAIECIKNRNTTKSKKERFMNGETTLEKVLEILGDKEND